MKKKTIKNKNVRTHKGKVTDLITVEEKDENTITVKLLEYKEMQTAEQELAGQISDKYCYEYEKNWTDDYGNKHSTMVRGIRAAGARECIRFTKIKKYNFIPKWKYEIKANGDGTFLQIAYCTNPKTGEVTPGQCVFNPTKRFNERIALTIARRNAMLEQIPTEIKVKFVEFCVTKGYVMHVDTNPQLPENKEAIKQLDQSMGETAEQGKSKTALTTILYTIIGSMGIDTKLAGIWLHKKYKVKSLNDLSETALQGIIKGFRDIQSNTPAHREEPMPNVLTPEQLKEEILKGASNGK